MVDLNQILMSCVILLCNLHIEYFIETRITVIHPRYLITSVAAKEAIHLLKSILNVSLSVYIIVFMIP